MNFCAGTCGKRYSRLLEKRKFQPRPDDWQNQLVLLALLAVLPMIGAQFGYGNQIEQFSIVMRLLDPAALPSDFYVDASVHFGPRYYYARVLAALASVFGLAVAVHGLSILCNFALAAVSYAAATRFLGASAVGGSLAAVLAVMNGGFSLGYAGYLHFDSLQPASLAIPLALIGFYLTLTRRPFAGALAFAAGALMHPLIGMEIAAIVYAATGMAQVALNRRADWLRVLLPLTIAAGLFGLIMIAAWAVPMLGVAGERMSDSEFFHILAVFRAPHHYLGRDFFGFQWVFAGLFCAAAAAVFALRFRQLGCDVAVLALVVAIGIAGAACLASLYFVDLAESRLWTTAQVFRMTMLVKWCAYLTIAWLFGEWIRTGGAIEAVLAGIAVLAAGDALSYVLIMILAAKLAIELARRWPGGRPAEVLAWLGLPVLFMAAGLVTYRYGQHEDVVRAALALACIALIFAPRPGRDAGMGLAVVLTAAAVTLTTATRADGLFGWDVLKAEFVWSDLQSEEADIARAAKANSPPDALWVVPTRLESFRTIANRAVVVDFVSIPFQDKPMREWRRRLEMLYAPGDATGFDASHVMTQHYKAGIDWQKAAEQFGATHAVLFKETPWSAQVLYSNSRYKLVRLQQQEQR